MSLDHSSRSHPRGNATATKLCFGVGGNCDRAERFTPGSATQPVIATPTTDTGIDWSDPLIVGAATVLVAGLATLAAFAVVHRRGGGPGMRGTPGTPTPTH